MPIRLTSAAVAMCVGFLLVGCSGATKDDRPGAAPPTKDESLPEDAQFVRYVNSEEWGEVYADCVRSMGFQAQVMRDGSVLFGDVPGDQQGALKEAGDRCDAMYPTHPRYEEPHDDEQMAILYDYLVRDLTGCLRGEGYEVTEPPSLETFIAQHRNPRDFVDGPWSPYRDLRAPTTEEWYRINETCPQSPPLDQLYGEDRP